MSLIECLDYECQLFLIWRCYSSLFWGDLETCLYCVSPRTGEGCATGPDCHVSCSTLPLGPHDSGDPVVWKVPVLKRDGSQSSRRVPNMNLSVELKTAILCRNTHLLRNRAWLALVKTDCLTRASTCSLSCSSRTRGYLMCQAIMLGVYSTFHHQNGIRPEQALKACITNKLYKVV